MMATPRRQLADSLARGIFTGRVAIWGVALPLAALVVAWCAILITGDEDAAVAFGGRWGEWYALWLFGFVIAVAARGLVPVLLLARRRRRRIADIHASLARALGRKQTRPEKRPNPLATAAVAVIVSAIILSLAAPAVNGCTRAPLWDFFGLCLFIAGVALCAKHVDHATKGAKARERFDEWKSRRASRREAREGTTTEGDM